MSFSVLLKRDVKLKIVSLPHAHQERVGELIDRLGGNPYPLKGKFVDISSTNSSNFDIKKCRGHQSRFRVRIGGHRLVYEIDESRKRVLVLKLDTRGDVY